MLGLVGLISLTGCSSDANSTNETNDTQNDQSATQDDEKASSQSDPVEATWPDDEDLVAEDVFPTLRSADQTVRVGIEDIIVTDDTMELRMVYTPEENLEDVRFVDVTTNMYSSPEVALIDRENLKKYSVLEEIDGPKRYQSSDSSEARAGETVGFQVFYPAPEDDIDVIDVDLGSSLPIFEDVPLTFED